MTGVVPTGVGTGAEAGCPAVELGLAVDVVELEDREDGVELEVYFVLLLLLLLVMIVVVDIGVISLMSNSGAQFVARRLLSPPFSVPL